MSKNPYQIRLETLCLARDILAERCRGINTINAARIQSSTGGTFDPETFDADTVLTEATKLYAFINDDG